MLLRIWTLSIIIDYFTDIIIKSIIHTLSDTHRVSSDTRQALRPLQTHHIVLITHQHDHIQLVPSSRPSTHWDACNPGGTWSSRQALIPIDAGKPLSRKQAAWCSSPDQARFQRRFGSALQEMHSLFLPFLLSAVLCYQPCQADPAVLQALEGPPSPVNHLDPASNTQTHNQQIHRNNQVWCSVRPGIVDTSIYLWFLQNIKVCA